MQPAGAEEREGNKNEQKKEARGRKKEKPPRQNVRWIESSLLSISLSDNFTKLTDNLINYQQLPKNEIGLFPKVVDRGPTCEGDWQHINRWICCRMPLCNASLPENLPSELRTLPSYIKAQDSNYIGGQPHEQGRFQQERRKTVLGKLEKITHRAANELAKCGGNKLIR